MSDDCIPYALKVTFAESQLIQPGGVATVTISAPSQSVAKSNTQTLQPLHRELLYALMGTEQDNTSSIEILTAAWYIQVDNDAKEGNSGDFGYYYFWDVVLRKSIRQAEREPAYSAMIPAVYVNDKDGNATKGYLKEVIKTTNAEIETLDKHWSSMAGRIMQCLTLCRNRDGTWEMAGDATLCRYPLGEFAGVLPTPGPWQNPGEKWLTEVDPLSRRIHRLVVATRQISSGVNGARDEKQRLSKTVSHSLRDLNILMRSNYNHVVLIMAEPGSGKEVFAQDLHFGTCEGWKKSYEHFRARAADLKKIAEGSQNSTESFIDSGIEMRSMAGISLEELNERLFTVEPNNKVSTDRVTLVEKAQDGGTIFLDDFDKPAEPPELYSAMLRVIAAKEFLRRNVYDDKVTTTPTSYRNVNWIMAGAFRADPRQRIPRELWPRVTGLLDLSNPIANDPDYVATLFMYTYLKQAASTLTSNKNSLESQISNLLTAVHKVYYAVTCSKKKEGNDCEVCKLTFRESVATRLLGYTINEVKHSNYPNDGHLFFRPAKALVNLAADCAKHVRFSTKFTSDVTDTPRSVMQAAEAAFSVVKTACIQDHEKSLESEDLIQQARDAAHNSLLISRGPS